MTAPDGPVKVLPVDSEIAPLMPVLILPPFAVFKCIPPEVVAVFVSLLLPLSIEIDPPVDNVDVPPLMAMLPPRPLFAEPPCS